MFPKDIEAIEVKKKEEVAKYEKNTKMDNSLSLSELIDFDELQAVQDSIAKTVGISSVISSPDGEPLTRFSYPTVFCSLIQSTEEWKWRCLLSFKEMSEKASALKMAKSQNLWIYGTTSQSASERRNKSEHHSGKKRCC